MVELVVVVIILFILAALLGGGCHLLSGYSTGNRVGHVTKLSYKGVVNKSWEGELVMGGSRALAEGGVVGNVWAFTVDKTNTKVIEDLQRAMDRGQLVRLSYEEGRQTPMAGDTPYRITAVTVVTPEKGDRDP